jgi:hypothetical protein
VPRKWWVILLLPALAPGPCVGAAIQQPARRAPARSAPAPRSAPAGVQQMRPRLHRRRDRRPHALQPRDGPQPPLGLANLQQGATNHSSRKRAGGKAVGAREMRHGRQRRLRALPSPRNLQKATTLRPATIPRSHVLASGTRSQWPSHNPTAWRRKYSARRSADSGRTAGTEWTAPAP